MRPRRTPATEAAHVGDGPRFCETPRPSRGLPAVSSGRDVLNIQARMREIIEAEAQAVRGSGLGCFFDDEVHKLIGLPDARFQALYHFAVGVPKHDDRLQRDADPYAALVAKGR